MVAAISVRHSLLLDPVLISSIRRQCKYAYMKLKASSVIFEFVRIMSFVLNKLSTKKEVDNAIKTCEDKVLVLRFGRETDTVCQQLDHIVRR